MSSVFCRYADDLVTFVTTPQEGERVMKSLSTFIERKLKLKVNREKSRVVPTKLMKFFGMTIIAGTLAISPVSTIRHRVDRGSFTLNPSQNRA